MSKRRFIELASLIRYHMTRLGKETHPSSYNPDVILVGNYVQVTLTPERDCLLVDYALTPQVSNNLPKADKQRILADAKTLFDKALATVAKDQLGIKENM